MPDRPLVAARNVNEHHVGLTHCELLHFPSPSPTPLTYGAWRLHSISTMRILESEIARVNVHPRARAFSVYEIARFRPDVGGPSGVGTGSRLCQSLKIGRSRSRSSIVTVNSRSSISGFTRRWSKLTSVEVPRIRLNTVNRVGRT